MTYKTNDLNLRQPDSDDRVFLKDSAYGYYYPCKDFWHWTQNQWLPEEQKTHVDAWEVFKLSLFPWRYRRVSRVLVLRELDSENRVYLKQDGPNEHICTRFQHDSVLFMEEGPARQEAEKLNRDLSDEERSKIRGDLFREDVLWDPTNCVLSEWLKK